MRDEIPQRLDHLPNRLGLLNGLALQDVLYHGEGDLGQLHGAQRVEADRELKAELEQSENVRIHTSDLFVTMHSFIENKDIEINSNSN